MWYNKDNDKTKGCFAEKFLAKLRFDSMAGRICFHFDDGDLSHYKKAFPIFQEVGAVGCIALIADRCFGDNPQYINIEMAREMQAAGWEILSHSVTHARLDQPDLTESAIYEIAESRRRLEAAGLHIRQFITPCSYCHPSYHALLAAHYDAAFTVYTNSAVCDITELTAARPVERFRLHRACLSGKTQAALYAYVDHVAKTDALLHVYDHALDVGSNITAERLRELLIYCQNAGVEIVTASQALEREKCTTRILRDGYDGKRCFVHARCAANENTMLMTAQYLDVTGSDAFDCLNFSLSTDGGKTFSALTPIPEFAPYQQDGTVRVPCDMTPFYHKKTGKFLVTGHTASYFAGQNVPVPPLYNRRSTPYAVFDAEKECFGAVHTVEMPDPQKYIDCGSGCSQICECENGDLLIPISFSEKKNNVSCNSLGAVMRCSFDGTYIRLLAIGDALEVKHSKRGIGEMSILPYRGRYYLTIRDDEHGYVAVSEDGLNYTDPTVWRFDDGEIIPTYNTQSHWFTLGDRAFLVYTRKNGKNDHVFRHRAPLYAAEFLPETLTLKRNSEFTVVPERGARLGNFGCFPCGDDALVIAAEWMQPIGCEQYGSNNAIWLTTVKKQA